MQIDPPITARTEPSLPHVPEHLLAPLLEVGGCSLETLMNDMEIRRSAGQEYLESDAAKSALSGWSVERALDRINQADARGELPTLVSALYAQRPTGWGYGLGAACALDLVARRAPVEVVDAPLIRDESADEEIRAALEMAEQAEETAKRAIAARDDFERRLHSAEHASRAEKAEAQLRAAGPARELEEAHARIDELAADIATLERRLSQSDAERAVAVDRARAAEFEVEGIKRGRAPAPERIALADAASLARRLSARLDELTAPELSPNRPSRAGDQSQTPTADRASDRVGERVGQKVTGSNQSAGGASVPRPAPRIPVGLRADTSEGVDALLRTPRLVVVVDGTDIASRAWPDERVSEQRGHLVASLRSLHSRFRCDITVVFAGDDLEPPGKIGRPGVRAVFSAVGEPVGTAIVREVSSVSASLPVLLISSDGAVAGQAEREGATVVAVDPFLSALRS
jgi:hypothetical protein